MEQFVSQFILPFLVVTGIQMLGLMSPGPDFAMVSKMSITHGRRIGIFTALGIALGISVHVGYSLAGIGYIMTQSILLFNVVKYAGAAYLIYIGLKSLFAKKAPASKSEDQPAEQSVATMQPSRAVRIGFLTNVLNPKATLFMFSLFTQVIGPDTAFALQAAYAIMIVSTTFMWFTLLASAWSLPMVKRRIHKIQPIIERGMGAVLVALGIKIVLPSSD